MKQYISVDPWKIVEDQFNPEYNRISESVCSLGNGRMGQRANFEEQYSGDTLQGSYIAGIYYPDKTKVGWWKNGYPTYFAKVLNAPNWIGIHITIDHEPLDLATCKVKQFSRVLNMKEGTLTRAFIAKLPSKKEVKVVATRFLSIAETEIGAIRYAITPLNFDGKLTITPFIDADIKNEDSNYRIKFWAYVSNEISPFEGFITVKTKKLDSHVCTGMKFDIFQNDKAITPKPVLTQKRKYISNTVTLSCQTNQETVVYKYAAITSSLYIEKDQLTDACKKALNKAYKKGFDKLLQEQKTCWKRKWEDNDIVIEGDEAAQQGIRFNIFQLNQTYTGEDERFNIGPKGFTGEKYGGSTYWDTEAYCIPFYLSTAPEHVARNLLLYRYKQLPRAIENAEKLGFTDGAALYPMVTMNGEECHNEWEITFEEIHRNGAIAYAIYNYIRYTGDESYLANHGLEVLISISRFWAQRVNWSDEKNKFVMLGVTGPNEYENNVNNNWYTNTLASWCLTYTLASIKWVKKNNADLYTKIVKKHSFQEDGETKRWKHIVDNLYFPSDPTRHIFLQQDGYLDKEQILVKDLNPAERPINQRWSWDRILRSCFIKQADVLQGLFFFEDQYDDQTIRRNYDFYEPRTVHESSLSPCVHAILAAKLGYHDKAYEFYLRTARLDLDDYNNDTCDGCHTTSMAGTWMSVVQGFGGMRVRDNELHFNPFIPKQWEKYAFKILFRGHLLRITTTHESIKIENLSHASITVVVRERRCKIAAQGKAEVEGQGPGTRDQGSGISSQESEIRGSG